MKYFLIFILITNITFANDEDFLLKEVPVPPVDAMMGPEPEATPKIKIVKIQEEPGIFSEYEFEANIFAQSIRTANSPLIGPSVIWEFTDSFFVGIRALISLSGTSEEAGYSFESLQRWKFLEKSSSLFIEFSQGYNQVNRTNDFNTLGMALGIKSKNEKGIRIGGLAGIVSDLDEGEHYPKVATFVTLSL